VRRARRFAPALAGLAVLLAVAVRVGSTAVDGRTSFAAQERPFRHASHEAISCAVCHGTGPEHRTLRVWTPDDCAACHHDPHLDLPCARCHAPADYEPTQSLLLSMSLSVHPEAITRTVPFDHTRHGELACAECHSAADGVRLTPPACATCHLEHHEGNAECTACHVQAPVGAHGLEVHATCAGSGCHAVAEAQMPPLSRSMCLACHVDQRDHEPGGVCYRCHVVPYGWTPGDISLSHPAVGRSGDTRGRPAGWSGVRVVHRSQDRVD
jgi:hypothetical protein